MYFNQGWACVCVCVCVYDCIRLKSSILVNQLLLLKNLTCAHAADHSNGCDCLHIGKTLLFYLSFLICMSLVTRLRAFRTEHMHVTSKHVLIHMNRAYDVWASGQRHVLIEVHVLRHAYKQQKLCQQTIWQEGDMTDGEGSVSSFGGTGWLRPRGVCSYNGALLVCDSGALLTRFCIHLLNICIFIINLAVASNSTFRVHVHVHAHVLAFSPLKYLCTWNTHLQR